MLSAPSALDILRDKIVHHFVSSCRVAVQVDAMTCVRLNVRLERNGRGEGRAGLLENASTVERTKHTVVLARDYLNSHVSKLHGTSSCFYLPSLAS